MASSTDSSKNKPRCILHVGGESSETLKPFDKQSWQKVKEADYLRRNAYHVSKYFSVILSDQYDSNTLYHSKCYKDFTALRKDIASNSLSEPVTSKSHTLRSDVKHPVTTSSGVHEHKCLFCAKVTKSLGKGKREYLGRLEMDKGEDSIKDAAELLQDDQLLVKISGENMITKEIKFHHSCRKSYINRAKRSAARQSTEPSPKLSKHNEAFDSLKCHVQDVLVDHEGAEKLTSLHARYITCLGDPETTYSAQSLCEKLLKHFPGQIKTGKSSNKEGIIVYHPNLSLESAIKRANFDCKSIKETAFYLRSVILAIQSDKVTEISLTETEVDYIPQELFEFFQVLYTGSTSPTDNERVQRLICSISDDAIFATTRGKVKPRKHCLLGLGLKSMTGSRRVLEILNRFGHSISYHTAESLETQMASDITDRTLATPDGLLQKAGLCTGLAWDNYDENADTLWIWDAT